MAAEDAERPHWSIRWLLPIALIVAAFVLMPDCIGCGGLTIRPAAAQHLERSMISAVEQLTYIVVGSIVLGVLFVHYFVEGST